MTTGDLVTIEYDGRCVPGAVTFVSRNGKALMVEFEAILGGHVGQMLVLQLSDTSYMSVIEGRRVSFSPRVEEATCPVHGTQHDARAICPLCVAEERHSDLV